MGKNAPAIHKNALAIIIVAVAIGKNAPAIHKNALAIIIIALAIGKNAPAIHENARAIIIIALAIGKNAPAIHKNALAIIIVAVAIGENAPAIHKNARAIIIIALEFVLIAYAMSQITGANPSSSARKPLKFAEKGSVRAWSTRDLRGLGGPKGRHIPLLSQLFVPRLRRSINLDWLIHDLTVVAIS